MGLKATLALGVLLSFLTLSQAVVYRPACNSYADPPPGGWKKWSDPGTWPKRRVPGINGNKAFVTIPCDTGVILDISVTVSQIVINGSLKVVGRGPYLVNTNFVVVQGKLIIGSEASPYTGKVTFNLTYGRYTYGWNRKEGSDNAGVKAFIILGGSVLLNGMYGNQKAWTTLRTTAKKGTTSITVAGDVSAWPVGGKVVVSSTDFDYSQAETRVIKGVSRVNGGTVLKLNKGLSYMHWGNGIETGVKGVTMSQAAEVALLDRSIVIIGEASSDTYLGGHFVIFKTQTVQKIIGVEFENMGQQGRDGRFPVYFKECGNVKGSVVKKVSFHKSLQRCVVIHGTWNARIEGNAAYDTRGHCYYLEDGIEFGNVFKDNLGIATKKASKLVTNQTNAPAFDNFPATFFITNPNNKYTGNVAAGSEDSGFWFFLNDLVRGNSKRLSIANGIYPRLLPLDTFSGNTAHSNFRSGLKFYPRGYRPRAYDKNSKRNPLTAKPVPAIISNFRAYKNARQGVLVNMSDSITINGGFFADNRIAAVEIQLAEHIIVRNAFILGQTANVGNPTECGESSNVFANCEPLSGSCALPVSPSKARSLGLPARQGPTIPKSVPSFGVWLSQSQYPPNGALTESTSVTVPPVPNKIQNVTFALFNNRCRPSAAITGNGVARKLFLASHSTVNLRFPDSSPRVYFPPRSRSIGPQYSSFVNGGTASYFYAIRDLDGSLVRKKGGGYAIASTEALLPALSRACEGVVRGSYGYLCPGTCFRTVLLDSGKGSRPGITVTNPQTKTSFTFTADSLTSLNLRAASLQVLYFRPAPEFVQIYFGDPEGCRKDLNIGFKAPSGYRWTLALVQDIRPCEGKATDSACDINYGVVCTSPDVFRLFIGGKTRSRVVLNLVKGKYNQC